VFFGSGDGDIHRAYRFLGWTATRPGDTGYGQADVGAAQLSHATAMASAVSR
jgi:hypothetical protein